MREKNSVI